VTLSNSIIPRSNPVLLILTLALAPAIGLGIGRFAYSLLLPDMRDSLHWSYSTAGFMNTMNAAGYLAGALTASRLVRCLGLFRVVAAGTAACLISLVLCAISGHVIPFSIARAMSGFGAAIAFVAGGALAATIAQSRPEQTSVLLGLFYVGPGLGILVSGLAVPFLLQDFGPGSWWIVWAVLAGVSIVMSVPLLRHQIETPAPVTTKAVADISLKPIAIYLLAYFLFGAGYIAYMTFMIAYVRDAGGGAAAQSAFWSLIGIGSCFSPWVWRRLMSRGASGITMAVLIGILVFATGLALLGNSPWLLGASAFVFGNAFFAVVTATTAFTRLNYAEAAWPKVIGIMTISFGLGQTLGPIVTGAITDAMGSLSYALDVSAATLALGAVLSAFQRPLPKTVD
jgi:predicted MFS family arabinose efflux permease